MDATTLQALAPLDRVLVETFSDEVLYEMALLSGLENTQHCRSNEGALQTTLIDAWEQRPSIAKKHLRSLR